MKLPLLALDAAPGTFTLGFFDHQYQGNIMATRSDIVQYIVDEYFGSNVKKAAEISGYTQGQISDWISGKRNPQKITVEYLIQCAFIPEFKVIAEFAEFDNQKALATQLKAILGHHAQDPGIYAFYDSMGNLLYIGKATKLASEIYSAINRKVHIAFPKGVKNTPQTRTEIVAYISAYDVGAVKWSDFPKHVESLLLRISKPLLNKNIGYLAKARKQPKET